MRLDMPDWVFDYEHKPALPTVQESWPWLVGPGIAAIMGKVSAMDAFAIVLAFLLGHAVWTLFLLYAFPLDGGKWLDADPEERAELAYTTGLRILGMRLFCRLPLIFFQLNCFTDWVILGAP